MGPSAHKANEAKDWERENFQNISGILASRMVGRFGRKVGK